MDIWVVFSYYSHTSYTSLFVDIFLKFLLDEDIKFEKEMATHSGILAWKITWTEEPGGLQSMGLQRVGHDRIILMGLRYRQSILEKKGDFYQWWGWGPCPVVS